MGNPPVCLGSFSEYPYNRHYPWGQSIIDVLARQIVGGLCIVLPLFMTTFLTAVGARLAIDSMLLLLRSSLLVLPILHRHRNYGVASRSLSRHCCMYNYSARIYLVGTPSSPIASVLLGSLAGGYEH